MARSRLVSFLLPALLFLMAAPALAARALPLELGKRWELASGSGGGRMSLEVTGRDAQTYVMRWDNPYVKTVFHFRLDGAKVLLEALDMGSGLARMPAGTVYFDLDARPGQKWRNSLGEITVLARDRTVGRFSDGVEFQLTDPKGAKTFWTLSPTGGFLAFGQGRGAFVLRDVAMQRTPGPATNPIARDPAATPFASQIATAGAATDRVLVGLDANPTPNEGYDEAARRNRVRMAVQAGVNFMYIHPKWTEAEPSAGRYDHAEVDFKTRLAAEHGLPVSFSLRLIDTNQRAIPDAYTSWRFNDERLVRKLVEVLRAVAPRTAGRVRWVTLGNEVNNYFDSRRGEIAEYADLVRRVLPTVRELFPGALFTINFTHAAVHAADDAYRPLLDLVDVVSYTYYPLNADFTFQDPEGAERDIDRMVLAAAGKRVLFQEIGYASSALVASSEERQARFLANVFAALRKHRGRVIAANFVWMSDLPQSVVDELGRYYGLGNADRFKAFLGSLGYWDRAGQPKKAWSVFRAEAPRM